MSHFNNEKEQQKDFNNININSSYEENYSNPDSHFKKYSNNFENQNSSFSESFYYNPQTNSYYKNTKSTFSFVDPKTGKMHKINVNKAEKTNIFNNQYFYENQENLRKMREKETSRNSSQFNDYKNNYNMENNFYSPNIDQNSQGDNNPRNSDNFDRDFKSNENIIYHKNKENSFVIGFDYKYFLAFGFIMFTIVSFVVTIKKSGSGKDPLYFQNSILYPKSNDPILQELIMQNKIDVYQLDKINNAYR